MSSPGKRGNFGPIALVRTRRFTSTTFGVWGALCGYPIHFIDLLSLPVGYPKTSEY